MVLQIMISGRLAYLKWQQYMCSMVTLFTQGLVLEHSSTMFIPDLVRVVDDVITLGLHGGTDNLEASYML